VILARRNDDSCRSALAIPEHARQVYSLVRSRTTVDRELGQAVKDKRIKLFRVPGHPTDDYLLAMTDYLAILDTVRERHLCAVSSNSRKGGGARAAGAAIGRADDSDDDGAGAAQRAAEAQEIVVAFKRFPPPPPWY